MPAPPLIEDTFLVNLGNIMNAPTCVGPDNPARYERAVYRDLVLAFYNANYFHRKNFAGHPAA